MHRGVQQHHDAAAADARQEPLHVQPEGHLQGLPGHPHGRHLKDQGALWRHRCVAVLSVVAGRSISVSVFRSAMADIVHSVISSFHLMTRTLWVNLL